MMYSPQFPYMRDLFEDTLRIKLQDGSIVLDKDATDALDILQRTVSIKKICRSIRKRLVQDNTKSVSHIILQIWEEKGDV